jgi:hypothetical protein
MSAPTVEDVRKRGGFPFRGLDNDVVQDAIASATLMVDDKITAYIEKVGALTISDSEKERLILWMACQNCVPSARTIMNETGLGNSVAYVKDASRFRVAFHKEWIRLTGPSGGYYAINQGFL